MSTVRTRMAPSPTGNLHIGTVYATMWPYLYARSKGGVFLIRIEDTDQERSTKEFEKNIIEGLKWMGLESDEEIVHQMDRLDLYKKYTEELLKKDAAYYCFCTKEELDEERKKQIEQKLPQVYSGKCRNLTKEQAQEKLSSNLPYVIRYKLPEDRGAVEYEDMIHGKTSVDSKLIGDMVIMRASGIPLYNFAVVVDDIDMEITDVIRGDDHISNTPKQILIFEALGKAIPRFGHCPVILNQDRVGKLSKRTGSTSFVSFIDEGYLPEAMFNYIALLGWSPKDDREIFSREEIESKFNIQDMHKSAAAWNQDKLDWINGEYIRAMSDEELTKRLQEFLVDHPNKEKIAPVVPLIKERIKKLSDFVPLTFFLFETPEYDLKVFDVIKIENGLKKEALHKMLSKLEELNKPWDAKEFEEVFRKMAEELAIPTSAFFQLMRVAFSGQLVTPPLFESMKIVGEEETIARFKEVVEKYPNFNPITGH